mgnify:CR=1 FL=1
MEFWNSLLTEKSWNLLTELKKKPIKFIVIGGWAIYLHAKAHKSKDIDIIVRSHKDLDWLKRNYDLRKNERLRKYEIKVEEIDIDIYVSFYSKLGLPVEDLLREIEKIEGFDVVKSEVLLILKQAVEMERRGSVKGMKDRIDIMTLLLFAEVDFKKYNALLKKYKIEDLRVELTTLIREFKDIQYLNLNPREFKLRKMALLKKI